MKSKPSKLWFKRKTYGWGWTPSTWQGWVVLLIWAIFFGFSVNKMDHEWLKNFIVIFISTAILLFICWKKGEKPRWQWGNHKNNRK